MADLCCANSGGRVSLTVHTDGGTRKLSIRANVTIMPTTVETEALANSDGSMYVTTKPVPATVELSISDKCGLRMEDLLNCYIDATLEMIDMRRTYLFTRARMVGRPSIKAEDGEISGVKLASANVSMIESI
jgi:hypothetical protein